ncbi:DUF2970 domain-containing protein [Zobellella maritima]|uniref:DUF2970 domain-containing protein n=1 Tax=Zobellella maritima TaxID=2059725 RepID=UPI000E30B34D|nr:DUF2970 domain-containing protein [Zobellella maritima]
MSWKQILQAVAAALFGVQSEQNRRLQFQGSPWPYICIGTAAIVLLVMALLALVNWVLPG